MSKGKINSGITIAEDVMKRLDEEVEAMRHRSGGFGSRSSYISETLVERWRKEDTEREEQNRLVEQTR